MEKGVLSGERLTCPWHAACFNIETGDIEDGPVFDRLPVYATEVDAAGGVFVRLPAADAIVAKAPPHMCPASASDARHFVVIGAGPAGLAAAETLRSEGFGGRITLLSSEAAAPYDRTKLSKNMGADAEDLALRPASWYAQHGIALRTGARVAAVRGDKREVVLASGETVAYDKLLCASGGPARTFRAGEGFVTPGAELANIFPLREGAHAAGIEAAVDAVGAARVRVVIVGSSFIGMEAAAYLVASKKVASVAVVGMEGEPFERVLGPALGRFMRGLHEDKGVVFHMRAKVLAFEGPAGGAVTGVRVAPLAAPAPGGAPADALLPADVVILGAGIIPAVEYLRDTAGARVLERAPGGVEVDGGMRLAGAGAPADVWAAGDIAYFPYAPPGAAAPHHTRIEHWDVAIDQARVAARNMLGRGVLYTSVPFFWTTQYGKTLRYAGHALKTDDVIVHGSTAGGLGGASFTAFFVVDAAVAAVATWAADPAAVAALELLRLGAMPHPDKLRGAGVVVDLVELLRKAQA